MTQKVAGSTYTSGTLVIMYQKRIDAMLDIVTAANAAIARYYTECKRVPLRTICDEIATRHSLDPSTVYGLAYKEREEMNQ